MAVKGPTMESELRGVYLIVGFVLKLGFQNSLNSTSNDRLQGNLRIPELCSNVQMNG